FLKRYWPVEFFAALLTCDKDSTESVVKFIAEARARGMEVLRPDVNESDADFTVVRRSPSEGAPARKGIRFGLAAVKGVGEGAGVPRARIYAAIGAAMERAARAQAERESGQTSLLDRWAGVVLASPAAGGPAAPGSASVPSGAAGGGARLDEHYPEGEDW